VYGDVVGSCCSAMCYAFPFRDVTSNESGADEPSPAKPGSRLFWAAHSAGLKCSRTFKIAPMSRSPHLLATPVRYR